MQELRPRDMSLPDRVSVLERGLERERNKRKILTSLVLEMVDKGHLRLTPSGRAMLEEVES